MSDFSDLPMFLKEYIHENRWDSFRDVQLKTFAVFKENDDHIIISSATSSGKTEAALFPVISSLYDNPAIGIGALYIGPLGVPPADVDGEPGGGLPFVARL